jgi:glucose/arabinose dehydrogenase
MRALRNPLLWPVLACSTLLAGCGAAGNPTSTKAPPPPPHRGKAPVHLPVGSGQGGVKLTQLGNFDQPLYVTQPRGEPGDLFVVERGGAIRVIHDGKLLSKPFLDVGDKVTDAFEEQGLLSMAFAPAYRHSGVFYVDYTDRAGDTRVVAYRRSADDPLRADPSSARLILGVDQPDVNHNGGLVLFGPDGDLYVGLGDGGSEGDPNRLGQDLSSPLAKILRIDPTPGGGRPYSIPHDNPFVGRPGDRPETYLYGLRNPWRFSFDRLNGALTIGDVGQDNFEEIDYVPHGKAAGDNFGWSAYEGDARYNRDQTAPGAVRPILTYSHDGGACSVTGGYIVRDPGLRSLYGRYIYGDFCTGELRSFIPSSGGADDDRALGLTVPALSSFGEDNAGRIYATSLGGPVYRFDPATAP